MKILIISALMVICGVAGISLTHPQTWDSDRFDSLHEQMDPITRHRLYKELQKTRDRSDVITFKEYSSILEEYPGIPFREYPGVPSRENPNIPLKEYPSIYESIQNNHRKTSGAQSHHFDEFSERDQVQSKSTTEQPSPNDFSINIPQRKPQVVDDGMSRGSQKFMLKLFSATTNTPRYNRENFVMSPYSIWFLMLLIAEGATDRSFNQIQQTLELKGNLTELRKKYRDVERHLKTKSSSFQLDVNQALIFDRNRPINDEYGRILKDEYDADLLPVNFQESNEAANIVNGHISKKTHGQIQTLLNPTDLTNVQLLLTSAIYFKGKWKFPFKSDHTTEEPFYRDNGDLIGNVTMMKQRNSLSTAAISELDASVLELPYGDDDQICLWLILPFAGTTSATVLENLRDFSVAEINDELHRYDENADHEPTEVVLTLPRFKIESNSEVSDALQRLGISDIFNPSTAHLEKMSKQASHISRIVHKAVIEVNEVGTIASAAAGATLSFKQLPNKFSFNRPFHFMIVDRATNIPLFSGQVLDPLH